jgi:hypothetical protein
LHAHPAAAGRRARERVDRAAAVALRCEVGTRIVPSRAGSVAKAAGWRAVPAVARARRTRMRAEREPRENEQQAPGRHASCRHPVAGSACRVGVCQQCCRQHANEDSEFTASFSLQGRIVKQCDSRHRQCCISLYRLDSLYRLSERNLTQTKLARRFHAAEAYYARTMQATKSTSPASTSVVPSGFRD